MTTEIDDRVGADDRSPEKTDDASNEARGAITAALARFADGAPGAEDELFRLVYEELRRRAGRVFRSQAPGHTLQPTVVVNEFCLRIMKDPARCPQHRRALFKVAAVAMRRILIDHVRVVVRRGGRKPLLSGDGVPATGMPVDQLLAIDDALTQLEQRDTRAARVVELKVYGGLTTREIANVLDVGTRTVEYDWQHARAWLSGRLAGAAP